MSFDSDSMSDNQNKEYLDICINIMHVTTKPQPSVKIS